MKTYKIMNFVIVVLVITALYQTGELWLGGTASHSFFDLLADDNQTSASAIGVDDEVLLATRYAVGEGEGAFSIHYPAQAENNGILDDANLMLDEILSDHSVEITQGVADWKEILRARSLVLQYDFLVSTAEYLANYKSAKVSNSFEGFDYITIVPSRRLGETSVAYFVNSSTNAYLSFVSQKSQTAPTLYEKLVGDAENMTYISTGQKTGTSIIWRNLFLPQWASLPYTYHTLKPSASFEKDGSVDLLALEGTVKGFFRNFSMDWSSRDGSGNYSFSDSQTVVKYYPDKRVLEYFNYDSYGTDSTPAKLLDGYEICLNFLQRDTSLKTGVYLADIETKSNEVIYYFDYVVNELPVYLSFDVQGQIGSEHAIEIAVRNQAVKKYQRYAMNFSLTEDVSRTLDIQFIDALDNVNKMYQSIFGESVISEVNDIALGYYMQGDTDVELKWFITLYERMFITETDTKNLKEFTPEELLKNVGENIPANDEG